MITRFTWFIVLFILGNEAVSQTRSVSVISENLMHSYTVTRYSPAWEVQSGQKESTNKVLAEHARFFRKIENNQVARVKHMIYANGFMPNEVSGLDAPGMESYLAKNRLVMHYRIQYKNHSIFLAHLNNSVTRSVIPFRIDGNNWLLDPMFTESEFFQLIAQPSYDPFTGLFEGAAICDFGFEEVDNNGLIYDYSGKEHHAMAHRATIVNGRIGGALKLGQDSEVIIDLTEEQNLKGNRFSVGMHLNIAKLIFNKDRRRIVFSAKKKNRTSLELFLDEGDLYLKCENSEVIMVPYNPDSWFHLTVDQSDKKISVYTDGELVSSVQSGSSDVLDGTIVQFGGRYSFKGTIDEFRISR